MKVKLVNQVAPGLIDPITMRRPFIDAEGNVLEQAEVPETAYWIRRVMEGDIARVDAEPTGSEPVAPLTTRGARR